MKKTGLLASFLTVVFLNAFVDLGHKIIIQNTVFKVFDGTTLIILTAIVNGLILLPFLLLFSTSGFLADKFAKPRVMRLSALAAVGITLGITLSYYQGWYLAAFGLTFILAAQSAIYAPAKYGYIKEFMGDAALTKGNGYVQAVTIIAILAGTLFFSIWFEGALAGKTYSSPETLLPHIAHLGWVLVGLSSLEFFLCFPLTSAHQIRTDLQLDRHKLFSGQYLKENFAVLRSNKVIWVSVLGLSTFWAVSQLVLASFPAYAKNYLALTDTRLVQGMMACTGIGVAIGSIIASRNAVGRIRSEYLLVGAVSLVLTLFLLPFTQSPVALISVFIFYGISAGAVVVPLNTMIQQQAPPKQLGTIIAGNNWVQTVAMVSILLFSVISAYQGFDSINLFYTGAVIMLLGLSYSLVKFFHLKRRIVLYLLSAVRYDTQIHRLEHLPKTGGVLLLPNHISYLDWFFIQLASPRPVRFIMHTAFYKGMLARWFFNFFGVIPINSSQSKQAIQAAQQALQNGEVVCVFTEGGLTHTGKLDSIKPGYQKMAEGTHAAIIPMYLHGLWGSRFSRAPKDFSQRTRPRWKRKVDIVYGPAIGQAASTSQVKDAIRACATYAFTYQSSQSLAIDKLWIAAVKKHPQKTCLQDTIGDALSSHRALTGSLLFAKLLRKYNREQNVGLLLPTASANAIVTMATWLAGKTVVQLNYTANTDALLKACQSAAVRTIFTSRKFLEKLQQKGITLDPVLAKVNVYYLEDLKEEISTVQKTLTLLAVKLLPTQWLQAWFSHSKDSQTAASILFSSGSEGTPKGVVLSHQGLIANALQAEHLLALNPQDVFMANLPLFHAFGLTVTTVLPLINGIPTICHPDPTDGLAIAKAIAQHDVTFYCSTPTFLQLLTRNKKVDGTMLASLRYTISGAEKLQPHVREAFQQKFHQMILEGYGATETGPIANVNFPDFLVKKEMRVQVGSKAKSVGLPLPGTVIKIVDPETYQPLAVGEAGMILIAGPQLMQGYLHAPEKTAQALIKIDNMTWYVTGDKGLVDEDGFLQIVDRYSRFAKIGGEMVSLGAVESAIQEVIKDTQEEIELSAVNMPDKNKGEHIVLMFAGDVGIDDMHSNIQQSSLSPLMKPKSVHKVEEIPKLGSGKSDFSAIKKLAQKIVG